MINRLVQWILSELFPYNSATMAKETIVLTHDYGWDKLKFHENEEFCGRKDNLGRY